MEKFLKASVIVPWLVLNQVHDTQQAPKIKIPIERPIFDMKKVCDINHEDPQHEVKDGMCWVQDMFNA